MLCTWAAVPSLFAGMAGRLRTLVYRSLIELDMVAPVRFVQLKEEASGPYMCGCVHVV